MLPFAWLPSLIQRINTHSANWISAGRAYFLRMWWQYDLYSLSNPHVDVYH